MGVGRDRPATDEIIGQVWIRQFQYGFERIQFGGGEPGDPGGNEATDQYVVLVRAAMRGAEQQTPAPAVKGASIGRRLGGLNSGSDRAGKVLRILSSHQHAVI